MRNAKDSRFASKASHVPGANALPGVDPCDGLFARPLAGNGSLQVGDRALGEDNHLGGGSPNRRHKGAAGFHLSFRYDARNQLIGMLPGSRFTSMVITSPSPSFDQQPVNSRLPCCTT